MCGRRCGRDGDVDVRIGLGAMHKQEYNHEIHECMEWGFNKCLTAWRPRKGT